MKITEYYSNSALHFGKYKGETLMDIVDTNPRYIGWCILNLDHFYISDETIQELEMCNDKFILLEDEVDELNKKFEYLQEDEEVLDEYDYTSTWSHRDVSDYPEYNSALEMDEQSLEFWNNF